jgi:hypothetical protein
MGIRIKADAAGIGIPASIISVQYQRIPVLDCVSLFQYRNGSGIIIIFLSGTRLTGWRSVLHRGIQKSCTKGGNLVTVQ